jgi:hypothetical protein
MVNGLFGIVRRLVDNVRRALCLEIRAAAYPHLADGPVFPKEVVQVWAGDVPVPAG